MEALPSIPAVTFVTKLASLGRQRERWIITIPPDVSRLLEKNRVFQITLSPMGSIH